MPFVVSKGIPIVIKADISKFQKSFAFIDPSIDNSKMTSLHNIRLAAFQKYLADDVKEMQADSM